MIANARPLSVTILACVYIVVGTVGVVHHFAAIESTNVYRFDGLWIEVLEVLAIIAGVFMLGRRNWARWLAIAWMAVHVVVSVFNPVHELIIHTVVFAVIAWLLFRPAAVRYFRT
jgi:hypothetical protein